MNKIQIFLLMITLSIFNCNNDSINFESVKNGEYLEVAEELTISEFFQIWIRRTIPWKANVQITEVFNDSTYTYFFEKLNLKDSAYLGQRPFEKGKSKIFKVITSDLNKQFSSYKKLDPTENIGVNIKKRVIDLLDIQGKNITFNYKLINNNIYITTTYDDNKQTVVYQLGKFKKLK